MKIYNSIRYTIPSTEHGKGMRSEYITSMIRPYKLTERGAERILRKETEITQLVVVSVECAIWGK
jgi:hypothetical protein